MRNEKRETRNEKWEMAVTSSKLHLLRLSIPHIFLRRMWGFLPFSLRFSDVFPVSLGVPFRLFLGGDVSMSMFASEDRCLFRGRVVAVEYESVLPTCVSTTLCGAFPDAKLGVGRGLKAANLPVLLEKK